MVEFTSIVENAAKALAPKLLLLTATEVETHAILERLHPLNGSTLFRTSVGPHTYHIGKFGEFVAVHTECNMGSVTSGGSTTTAYAAISLYDPTYVVMVGIAFGVNSDKQAIGDVLVADQVIPYQISRIGREETQFRGARPPSSAVLKDRFKNCSVQCLVESNNKRAIGALLSGESLQDNRAERDKLLAEFSHAIGGEMEGAGLFAAAHGSNKEWIIVKGICDFADGNKSVDKAGNQALAAKNAVALAESVFSQEVNFPALTKAKAVSLNPNSVLFEFYDKAFEPFYLTRNLDKHVNLILENEHLWLHGVSGMGKTVTVRRLLSLSAFPFLIIDLSSHVGQSVSQLLKEIAIQLGADADVKSNGSDLNKSIATLLSKSKLQYILIDELPIDVEDDFHKFRDNVCAILIGLRNSTPLSKLRVIVISQHDPKKSSKPFHDQIYEKLNVVQVAPWNAEDVKDLFELVKPYLPFLPSEQEQVILLSHAGPCPRKFKYKLRAYYTFKALNESFILTEDNCNEL